VTSERRRALALRVAWAYLGTWYTWGGDDPSGFDCSGLVLEALKSAGVFPRGQDTTADGLRRRYPQVVAEDVVAGDLVFWWNRARSRATHVGLVLEPGFYLGAEGGGPSTTTLAEARRRNAFVKVRPLASRRPADQVFGNPYLEVA
jgi:cell wall-associated NlpC family hydrolase